VRVELGVVEFFFGFGGSEEKFLRAGEFAFGVEAAPFPHGGHFFAVNDSLGVGKFGLEVADVFVARVANGADAVGGFIHAIACSEDVFARRGGGAVGIEDGLTVEFLWDFDPGQGKGGGAEIDESDEVFADGARFDFAGPLDEERDVNAAVVNPSFAAGEAATVIAEEKNDRIFAEAGGFDFAQDFAETKIDDGNEVIVVREIAADDGSIRMIRRQGGFGGIVAMFGREDGSEFVEFIFWRANLTFVGLPQVEVSEEWLARMVARVVKPVVGGVEIIFGNVEIEIRFAGPGYGITSFAKVRGEGGRRIEKFGTHVVRADRDGVAAGDESRTTRSADGSVSESACEAGAFGGEFIHVRSAGVGVAVTAEFGAEIFADDENDIGTFRGGREQYAYEKAKQRDDSCEHGLKLSEWIANVSRVDS